MSRLVAVSNKVGSTREAGAVGGLSVGLVAALQETKGLWFGWSGKTYAEELPQAPLKISNDGGIARALIDLPREDYEAYYAGYANRCLWPLLHFRIDLMRYDAEDFEAYLRINAMFARNLFPLLKSGDVIWVHDYQLFPLGRELRKLNVRQQIGFFLHTPFPPRDILNTLPGHADLMMRLFSYDLVGFQTELDLNRFKEYACRELRCSVRGNRLSVDGKDLLVGVYPIGINVDQVHELAFSEEAGKAYELQREHLRGRAQIIGADRLDYSKGLLRRVRAYNLLFLRHPEMKQKVEFLQIAPVSRGGLESYKRFGAELQQEANELNGRFAQHDWTPLRILTRGVPRKTLAWLYRASRVGVVTPVRDGMNLVAKEFIAAQNPEDPGVLVLSCFAGAAQQMKAALLVNPYDTLDMADALYRALTMSLMERRQRFDELIEGLQEDDIQKWRRSFVSELCRSRTVSVRNPTTGDLLDASSARP